MGHLKQSTARNLAFLMVDSADHITGKTGLTVTVTLSKDAGAFGAAGGTVSEISSGWYKIALTTTDTNTLGDLALHCTSTGADPSDFKEQVVAFDPADSVRAGLTALPNAAAGANGGLPTGDANARVDVIKVAGTTQTARDLGASVLLSSGTGTGQLDFTSGVVKANLAQILGTALTETAGQIAAGFKKVFDVAAPVFTAASVNQTGDNFARLGAPAGASVSADVASIKTDTGTTIPGRLPAALVSGRMDSSVGAMAANVLTATAINADAITAAKVADGTIDAATFAAGAINAAAIATDAITAAKIAADAIGASELAADAVAEIADQVWDEVLSGHLVAGSTGNALNAAGSAGDPWVTGLPGAYGAGQAGKIIGDNLNATVSSRSSHSAADVWAVGTRALTDKAGFSLSSAGVQAIWDALTSALTTAGSIGKLLVDNLNATVGSRLASASYTAPDNATITAIAGYVDTEVAAIKAKTDNLPASPAAVGSAMTLGAGAITASTFGAGAVDAAALNADAANEIADALLDRAAGIETNRTVRQGLRLMLAVLAGKLSGAATTTVTIRDTNDSKNRVVATVDSDGNRTAVTLDSS